MQLTYANKFYMISQLLELRPLYQKVSQKFSRFKELRAKELDGSLFNQGKEKEFEEYLKLSDEFTQAEKEYGEWEKNTTEFMQISLEEMKKSLGFEGKKKNKSYKEVSEDSSSLEKMKLLMDDVLGKDLWNGGNVNKSLAGMYIRSLTQYITAPEAAQSADFDPYVIDKVEKINQILPRSIEYNSAQAILLKEIKNNAKGKESLKKIYTKYCKQIVLREASTKGPDNQFFRCMAAGRFYVDNNDERYSEYFVSEYGKQFSLSSSTKGVKLSEGSFFNIDDMLELTAKTYDKETAECLKREIKIKGISEADFDKLNACDLCKILQRESSVLNGIAQGRSIKQINPDCPNTPYKQQARMLGMMLSIGEKYIQVENKVGDDFAEIKRRLNLMTIKSEKIMIPETVYEKNFKNLYNNLDSFLQATKKVYQSLNRDFVKHGMKNYFEKWIPKLCEGNYNPKIDEEKSPFEINVHHKIPIKMARDLDDPSLINNVCNFCMFIEFEPPMGDRLTKHLQEHNKESAGMAVVEKNADMRFVVTSDNTCLEYKEGKEPESFTKLRNKEKVCLKTEMCKGNINSILR